MFRYYQTTEKSKWKLITDNEKTIEEVRANGGIKLTVLALSEDITEDTDTGEVKYKGPFYADIDCKEDIVSAAKSALKLLDNLVNKDVPEEQVQVFASGSKGFHVILNERNFSSGRAVKGLPKLYKEMALALYVPGLDMQVYSMGKGNSWRMENVERYDGNYRVRITRKDLQSVIDEGREAYAKLVSSPNLSSVVPPLPSSKSHSLEALFEQSRTLANREPKTIEPIEDEKLKNTFKGELPQCIVDLREGKLRKGANFNQACLTVATYVSRVGMPEEERESLNSRMSEMTTSSSYNTPKDRYNHLLGLMSYTDTKPNYKHSCVATRGKVSTKPCEDCALFKAGDDETASMEDLGIAIVEGCYFRMGKENVRISTFFIANPLRVKGENEDSPGLLQTRGVQCDIITANGEVHRRFIVEGVWKSKSSFLGILEGIEGAVFLGSDLDVQKIKFIVFDEDEEMEEVKEVDAAGMHIDYHNGIPVPVYIEPNFSVNKYGVVNTHTLTREVQNPPHMTSISVEEDMIAAAVEAFGFLLKMNEPRVIVPLLGWFAACNIKSHIFASYRQFPLVNIWGNAGAGKTKTAELFMWLSGSGSKSESLSLSLPHTTKFPLIDYTTSTTTIPRILEEFNKARIGKANYDYFHELMKSAWNHHHVSRGALGSGSSNGRINAKSVQLKITSPILYVSEQPVESPPLKQRSISISMNSKGREQGREAFIQLEPIQHHLETIAKMMALTATRTSVSDVKDLVDAVDMSKYEGMEERPKFTIQVVVAGLKFLTIVLDKYNVRVIDLDSMVREYMESIDELVEEVSGQTTSTEVDQVIEDMALMSYLNSNTGIDGLEFGKHYFMEGDRLIIDMQVAHAMYKRYKRSEGGTLVIESFSQMAKLLRTEPYFVSDQTIPDGTGMNRKMTELSLSKMVKKGIEVSLFGEG